MSKTFKTQRAYLAHHTNFDDLPAGKQKIHAVENVFRDAGVRYGNQRKMRAKLKVVERRLRRRRENRLNDNTE